jgi:DNA (cytosine-5)-methyltransferase 1
MAGCRFHSLVRSGVGTNLDVFVAPQQPFLKGVHRVARLFGLPQGTLPHCCHAPCTLQKVSTNGAVPSNICGKFRLPELGTGRWAGGVTAPFMAMPEAAVHEDDCVKLGKHEVWPSRNPAGMKPETKAARVQGAPESEFRLRVLPPYSRHHPGPGLLINDIGHCILVFFLEPSIHRLDEFRQEPDLPSTFGIVDLFAGPGGLGEGFASLVEDGHAPFRIGISVEKEASAHQTLTLRAFLREYRGRHGELPEPFINFHAGVALQPDWSAIDARAWQHARDEARALELGTEAAATAIDGTIEKLKAKYDDTILIGGPPCQAYSLVGRARARGKVGYVPEDDARHYLFREYIRVLDRLRPAAFVMENVKGMLSSTVESRLVFEMLMEDLSSLGTGHGHHYELRAVRVENGKASLHEAAKPSDFIVRAEHFGVPQRRHRVIIVGIRSDLAGRAADAEIAVSGMTRTVSDAIGTMPALRSGISRGGDDVAAWRREVTDAARLLASIHKDQDSDALHQAFLNVSRGQKDVLPTLRVASCLPEGYAASNDELLQWLERPELRAIAQHETRGHMVSDLGRYLFAAVFGAVRGYSPKAADFPFALSPDHRNWHSGVFNDRFRVQLADEASTTVTSHISKDGHYFIHPDPLQCRSLTVREAARLQTFPDDYLFLGNRTQQYVQVGNAVPPFLARQIARLLNAVLRGESFELNKEINLNKNANRIPVRIRKDLFG